MSVGFLNSLLFSGYGLTLKYLHPNEKNIEHRKGLPMSEILVASIIGSAFQLIPAIPVELVKTKLQVILSLSKFLLFILTCSEGSKISIECNSSF